MKKSLSSPKLVIAMLLLILPSESGFARILDDVLSSDSAGWVVKEYQIEDETPYLTALLNKKNTIIESIENNSCFKQIASAYLASPISSGPDRSYGKSALGLTIGVLSALHADKKARDERDRITTPEQLSFVKMIVEKMRADNNIKDSNQVEKQMKKGKLSDKARPYIKEFLDAIKQSEKVNTDTINMINNWIKDGETIKGAKTIFPNKDFPQNYLTCVDTILNTEWRPYKFITALFDKDKSYGNREEYESNPMNNVPDKWSWIDDKSNRESITQDYPVYLSYYKYSVCPQYKVKQSDTESHSYEVYDSNGSLIYIKNGGLSDRIMNDSKFIEKIYAYAYKNNYYGIKKESAHTQHYVKNQAGLEKLTAKEEKEANKATDQMANAITKSLSADMRYGQNSRKANAIRNRSAATMLGALLGGSSFYDSKGKSWLNQIERDFSEIINKPYLVERIDETTYRNTYVDKEGNGLFEIITSYHQGSAPYSTVVNHEIRNLSKKFFTKEQLEQYISLRNKVNNNASNH